MIPNRQHSPRPSIPDYIFAQDSDSGDCFGFRFLALITSASFGRNPKPTADTRGYVFARVEGVETRFEESSYTWNVIASKTLFMRGKLVYSVDWLDWEFKG